ncbi:hypothetical protein ERO13_A07G022201v2 [Gossypium hirsutum]|nr:hypothetical protein ERO13_A07G022201v2 [Gossypium hirsutum]KAG4190284.1 hypothetical protein ERO13_A07G022201v2 [Gossypium hirsutum]KAG4190285.1 hypothetical protein ERO13_A07G022201v2 [Gossypium hirsutum]
MDPYPRFLLFSVGSNTGGAAFYVFPEFNCKPLQFYSVGPPQTAVWLSGIPVTGVFHYSLMQRIESISIPSPPHRMVIRCFENHSSPQFYPPQVLTFLLSFLP